MTPYIRTHSGIIRNNQAIKSVWILTLFNWRGIVYQAHMSLFLVLIWISYESYLLKYTTPTIAIMIAAILLTLTVYEILRFVVAKFSGLTFNQVTLYPFAGVSNINRNHLANLIETLTKQSKNEQTKLHSATQLERLVRMECIPAIGLMLIAGILHNLSTLNNHPAITASLFTAVILATSALLPVTPFPGAILLATTDKNWWKKRIDFSKSGIKILFLIGLIGIAFSIESITFTIIAITYSSLLIEQHMFEKTKLLAADTPIKSAMVPADKLVKLQHGQSIEQTIEHIAHVFQPIFPVFHAQQLVGFVQKTQLLRSLAQLDDGQLADIIDRDFLVLDSNAKLGDVLSLFQFSGKDYLVISDDPLARELIGIVTKDKILDALLIKSVVAFDPWQGIDND